LIAQEWALMTWTVQQMIVNSTTASDATTMGPGKGCLNQAQVSVLSFSGERETHKLVMIALQPLDD
jgi:hypothetical protein